jgi:hypothetical protein
MFVSCFYNERVTSTSIFSGDRIRAVAWAVGKKCKGERERESERVERERRGEKKRRKKFCGLCPCLCPCLCLHFCMY